MQSFPDNMDLNTPSRSLLAHHHTPSPSCTHVLSHPLILYLTLTQAMQSFPDNMDLNIPYNSHTHTLSLTYTPSHSYTHTLSLTYTPSHSHTHPLTHIHTLSLINPLILPLILTSFRRCKISPITWISTRNAAPPYGTLLLGGTTSGNKLDTPY